MKTTCSWRARQQPAPRPTAVKKLTNRAFELAGHDPQVPWDVNLVFLGDEEMARANADIMGHEGTTDVITLPYLEDADSLFAGDVGIELLISADVARREGARRDDSSYGRELALYIAHGLLHAVGCDDLDPASRRKMRRREREVLAGLAAEFDFDAVFAEKKREKPRR